MSCGDLDSLQNEYEKAVRKFTESVKELRGHTGDIPTKEYILLSDLAERARKKAEAAHRALREHIIEHGCS